MEIIPAIDLIDGKCVRLTEGDFSQQTTYHSDPVEVAKQFEALGLRRLHLVDLDGARAKQPVNLPILARIARETNLVIDYGGGLQSVDAIQMALDAGAQQVTAGSIAVREPKTVQKWLKEYGADRIIVGADFKDNFIAINAWADQSDLTLESFIASFSEKGAKTFICTDVSKDGKLQGSSLDIYQKLIASFPDLQFIASGGVTTIEEVRQLRAAGLHGAIIGKAIYEGTISLEDLAKEVI
ncbi:1-(5-phosphoribosyl)-5-[(5-phosphoribosylamino)methylideneamino] imidazole-4-carboxamide isomerase [Rufibacter radiotolerans]|uniref:1-(5-phosphoribosyl)-5-[(5-phosphoribosylamino)methylideneamino] imidazole-4-carboxamide isomerase n=1 Tax=Rufibacter radiotolerans TaxID=1379910 RepID=A0A0H4W5A1_9BACT|nr:1-(5-phosphoribosyl)-5-[(5-phosphoribosylamino)methylideneamino]imidazole-4-carboxamide isomerase [Rufibacter radiotolerans]AKQ45571.1 1-(5-phosphoribosyl)-5-[(5-phosphoribosylamino)methylideneamino] imidazole-4-carboxamide isomerase [Rufibacter radiotolerans]